MIGMNAQTGRYIGGEDHLRQSVAVIFSTPMFSRVKRRLFGCGLPDRIDAPGNQAVLTQVYADIATALMRWEPRLTVTRVAIDADAFTSGEFSDGAVPIVIEGYTNLNGMRAGFRTTVGTGSEVAA
ncbi:GPW/gp25 family protein [Burkholderia vietnamiensis]|uniref:GPW/gp25 family protein n=1 Tax=Burkholderia vietnamiensis TaxID=60552 RepID=UPI001CF33D0C|nr:GPW/gp25 family protein [Burkholderia vietnamiensis]MCA8182507.1 GPW/gp25 family protein [Burkholderia vietnamiensis]